MRVAVSGTHCSGKSTLVEAFLLEHPEYVHEPERTKYCQNFMVESFSEEPSAEDFFRQLEYQVDRLRTYECDDLVILERSPADCVAYLQALIDLERESADLRLVGQSIQIAREAFGFLDLVVFPAY
jgi:predicted ATPase